MHKFKSYDQPFTFNNKELVAHIFCNYDYETEEPDIGFESEEENRKYLYNFKTGEYSNLQVVVQATCLGEKGEDWLGQVHIVSDDINNQLAETIETYSMVENAIEDLRSSIIKKVDTFINMLGLSYENNK